MRKCFFSVFLATSLMGFSQPGDDALVPLSDRLQGVYAAAKPDGFLIDPQRLLRGGESRERREFLKYHSGDSLIDLYVTVFKADQFLYNPADLSHHHLGERSDAKPAVMVHYFMGEPDRAKIFLSVGLDEVVPDDEHARALSSAVERAKTGVSPLDELEKFIVQTSIRIYRMERLLSEGVAGPAPLIQAEPKVLDTDEAERRSLMQKVKLFWNQWRLKLIGGLVVLVGGLIFLRLRSLHAVHRFPDHETVERLGGAHGAGVGAVIEFGKTSKPPAAQLEKLKLH